MSNENFKSGFVTIVGRPNVGKSTLMNKIIGQKIAITSKKPQTTRNRIQTVYTEEDRGQIVFVDTPGIHKAKNKLGEFMVNAAASAMKDVDLVLWLVEPSEKIGPGDRHIAETLQNVDCPVILIINKSDTIAKKEDMLKFIDAYKNLMEFAEIIPASAMRGDGVRDVLDTIFKYLPEGPMYYDEDTVTDQPMRAIAAEIIREKALHALDDEIPHGIAVTVEKMHTREDKPITDIEATIIVERDSHKGIVIGKGGAMLKKIGTNARYEIEKLVEGKCNVKLWVKVRRDWRDSDSQLKNFGYVRQEEEI